MSAITINGYTLDHDIVLTRSDIPGVQNVDDTPDLQKPISISTQAALDSKQNLSDRNQANGYAGLNEIGKVPFSLFPIETMTYAGVWSASTNTPDISSMTNVAAGTYFLVWEAGTQMSATWAVYDIAISNGSSWQRIPHSSRVESVNGQYGQVELTKSDVGLSNVDDTSDMQKPVSTAQQSLVDARTTVPNDDVVYGRRNNEWVEISDDIEIGFNGSTPTVVTQLLISDAQSNASVSGTVMSLNLVHAYDAFVYPGGTYETVKSAVDAQCKNILITGDVEEEDVFAITYVLRITLNPQITWTCKGLSVQTSKISISSDATSQIVWKTVTASSFISSSSLSLYFSGHVIIDLQQQSTYQDLLTNVDSVRVNDVLEFRFGDTNYTSIQLSRSNIECLILNSMSLDGSGLYGLLNCSRCAIGRLELRGKMNDLNDLVQLDNCTVREVQVYDEYITSSNGYRMSLGGEVRSMRNWNNDNRIYIKVYNDNSIFTNLINTILDVNGKSNVMVSTGKVYISNSNSTTTTSCIVSL